jgi:hypothetical protein
MLLVKCILVGMIMVKCILGRFIHNLFKLCDDTSSAFFGAVALDKEPRRSLLRVFGFHKTHQLMSKCERSNLKYYYNAFGHLWLRDTAADSDGSHSKLYEV